MKREQTTEQAYQKLVLYYLCWVYERVGENIKLIVQVANMEEKMINNKKLATNA